MESRALPEAEVVAGVAVADGSAEAHRQAEAAIAGVVLAEGASEAPAWERAATAEDEAPRFPDCRLLVMLCSVGALEGADMVLLPCVFFALQIDLGLDLNDLATMSLVQALATNVAAPFWGVAADRGIMKRKSLIVVGCVVQGLITIVLAAVDQLLPMVILRGLNGVMLASLKPIANGIVADVTSEGCRGKVFGSMQFAMNLGVMAGTLIGTNLARRNVGVLQGWRVAFILIGGASVLLGVAAGILMKEPPRAGGVPGEGKGKRAVADEMRRLLSYFRLPSFCVLVLQGCFGSARMLEALLAHASDMMATASALGHTPTWGEVALIDELLTWGEVVSLSEGSSSSDDSATTCPDETASAISTSSGSWCDGDKEVPQVPYQSLRTDLDALLEQEDFFSAFSDDDVPHRQLSSRADSSESDSTFQSLPGSNVADCRRGKDETQNFPKAGVEQVGLRHSISLVCGLPSLCEPLSRS